MPSRRRNVKVRASVLIVCLGILYVCILPVSNGSVLYPTLAVITVASAVSLVSRHLSPPVEVVGAVLLLLATGIAGAIHGAFVNAPGWGQAGLVWVGSAIVWTVFGLGAAFELRAVLTVIAVGVLVVGVAVSLEVLAFLGFIPSLLPAWFSELQDTFVNGDFLNSGIKFFGLSTLAAGTPLMIALSMSPASRHIPPRILCLAATVAGIGGALLGGRRAILLVCLLSPIIVVLWRRLLLPRASVRKKRWAPLVTSTAVALIVAAVLFIPAVSGRVLGLLSDTSSLIDGNGGTSIGNDVRVEQAQRLLHAWGSRPFLGSGLGAILPDSYRRSVERPWTFELQYHLLIFNVGLLGVLAVLAGALLVFIAVRRMALANPELAVPTICIMTACTALLVANATNPYLQAVGHGWPLGLAIGLAARGPSAAKRTPAAATRSPSTGTPFVEP